MIRLVASDMDGTLLQEDGTISDRTARTVKELQESGGRFVVCTGRGYEDAKRPLEEKGILCDIICMNGAAVYNRQGQQVYRQELSTGQVKFIMDCCKEEVVFDFMTDRGSCTITTKERFGEYFHAGLLLPMAGGITYEYIVNRFHFLTREELFTSGLEFFKMSVIHPSPFVLERIKQELEGNTHLAVASSHHTNLEVTNSSAQKGLALLRYAQLKGIRSKEIMAIGDSENDLSMLSLPLGYTVAMENGMESVKQAAKCMTRSNKEDGVAYAIETLLFEDTKQAC